MKIRQYYYVRLIKNGFITWHNDFKDSYPPDTILIYVEGNDTIH